MWPPSDDRTALLSVTTETPDLDSSRSNNVQMVAAAAGM